MEELNNKTQVLNLKSQILLPVIFVLFYFQVVLFSPINVYDSITIMKERLVT